MTIAVKICGLTEASGLKAAIEAKADLVGFVFHPNSPRFVLPEHAQTLIEIVPPSIQKVGLFVDATDDYLRNVLSIVSLDMLQLHGNETASRARDIRAMTGLPIMTAVRVATAQDLKNVQAYEAVSDRLLFDTKVGEAPSGGTGKTFNWNLLTNITLTKPWMVAGGLNADNVTEAIHISKTHGVDVSSGVEDAPGQKSPAKIQKFVKAAKEHST